MGATVSVVLLIPAVLAFVVDRLVQRRQYALVTSSSQPAGAAARPLAGPGLLFVYCALIAACIAGIYLVILVVVPGHPLAVQLHAHTQALSLRHASAATRALWNSVYVAAWTAVVGTVLTFVGAYVVEKCRTARERRRSTCCPCCRCRSRAWCWAWPTSSRSTRRAACSTALYGTLAILVVSNVIHYFTVGLPHRDHRAQADGRRVRERLGVPGRAVLPDLLARDRADRAARPSSASACTSS